MNPGFSSICPTCGTVEPGEYIILAQWMRELIEEIKAQNLLLEDIRDKLADMGDK